MLYNGKVVTVDDAFSVQQAGTARRQAGDVFGDAVNVASRLEGIAEPGQVVVSAAVKERLGEPGVLQPLGQYQLKNVAEPVECWAITN